MSDGQHPIPNAPSPSRLIPASGVAQALESLRGTKANAAKNFMWRRMEAFAKSGQAVKIDGAWHIDRGAKLSDDLGRVIDVMRLFQAMPTEVIGADLPEEAFQLNEKNRHRVLAMRLHLKACDDFRKRFPRMPDSEFERLMDASEHGGRAREFRLSWKRKRIAVYRRRPLNTDNRGRPKKDVDQLRALCNDDDLRVAETMYLDSAQRSIRKSWEAGRDHAAANGRGFPSEAWFRVKYLPTIPKPAKVMMREGERAHDAQCLAKLFRNFDEIPSMQTIIGDERTGDWQVKESDGKGGWRLYRPKLTAWIDQRSRYMVGWVMGERANSDTILASFKTAALAHGVAEQAYIDNGKDYRSVGGGRGRKWDEFDARRMGTAFEQLGIKVHYARPYSPYSKGEIESFFHKMKDSFDREQPTFCGGSPDEKPHDLPKRLADLSNVPTLDESRAAFAKWLDEYHATCMDRPGMFGLSPNLAIAQFRELKRVATPTTLDLCCRKMAGPVKVRRDGVTYQGVLYGHFDEDLYALQGQRVWLKIDPGAIDSVVVCHENGDPITVVFNDTLIGATNDDVRSAAEKRARTKRALKVYIEGRLVDLQAGRTEQIANARHERIQAKQAETAAAIESARPPALGLVRPDVEKTGTAVETKQRARRGRKAVRAAAAANGTTGANRPVNGFDILAAGQSEPAPAWPFPSQAELCMQLYGDTPMEESA